MGGGGSGGGINIADSGYSIAIPRGLANYLDGIDTDLTAAAGVFNAHKAAGYAAALASLLGS